MIFSELYSAYYNTVAAIISRLLEGDVSERELQTIVTKKAFGESVLTVLPSLKSEKWQIMCSDMTTPIEHKPTMPLTLLQKQWLKAISLDPRFRLFGIELEGLDGVEPLFTPEDYHVYDKYSDGDPYEDGEYINKFRIILDAIRENKQIKIEMVNRKGREIFARILPNRLEYSAKDDKFRVIGSGNSFISVLNLARIKSCHIYAGERQSVEKLREPVHDTLTLKIVDERNALERVMLHFAHFEKQAEKIDSKSYLLKIKYSRDDEPEMVIRILSFGPLVEVIAPDSFREAIINKLKKQKNCGLK